MKRILILTTLIAAAGLAQAQTNNVAGDWHGTLSAGGAELRLVLHVTKAADGSLKANLDSIDQPGANIPVSSITFKDSKLSLEPGDDSWQLRWRSLNGWKHNHGQLDARPEIPARFQARAGAAKPSDIDGAWVGTLDTGTIKLHVVFHILNSANGLTATMDSPDQGMKGPPTSAVKRDGTSLHIEANKIRRRLRRRHRRRSFLDRRRKWHLQALATPSARIEAGKR